MAIPARLRNAPQVLLDHAHRVVGSDWGRVTYENGQLTIHNGAPPTKPSTAPPKAKTGTTTPTGRQRPRRARPAPTPAPTPAPAPPPLNRDPVFEGEFAPKVYEQKLVPRTAPAKLPKHLTPEPVRMRLTEPAPEPVQSAEPRVRPTRQTLKDKLDDAARAAVETPKLRRFDRPVPKEFDIKEAWAVLDVDHVATQMLAVCQKGLPDALPLDMHPEVLALEGINLELVATSVRNPAFVEIAGMETKEKGYPVMRFFRGDITTVVGLREATLPIVIATYALSRLDPGQHRVGSMKGATGGGGARKVSGLPRTPSAVQKRLIGLGATVSFDELHDKTAEVAYRGQVLGKVSLQADRSTCESDYQRMIRKMEAISRRD